MLYKDPQIFRHNGVHHFANFIGELLKSPFAAHVNQECRQLMPVFNAASDLLQPVAANSNEHILLSTDGIAKTHRMTSTAYGSLMFNMPLIIEEGFSGMGARSFDLHNKRIHTAMMRAGLKNIVNVANLEPGGGDRKYNRMFGVGRFGFITVKYNDGAYPKSLVFPYMSAPRDIMKRDGAKALLRSSARVALWQNHDWFHNITAGAINSTITGVSESAPIMEMGHSHIKRAYQTNAFRNQGEISFGFFTSNTELEQWAMRIQREILRVLMRPADNPVYDDIKNYIKTFGNCGFASDNIKMDDPAITPSEYAGRILAGSLVRSAPYYHRDTQRALRGCIRACESKGHDAHDSLKAAFKKIYDGKWAKRALFGGGENYKKPETYAAHIKDMSASAIALAFQESSEALNHVARSGKMLSSAPAMNLSR